MTRLCLTQLTCSRMLQERDVVYEPAIDERGGRELAARAILSEVANVPLLGLLGLGHGAPGGTAWQHGHGRGNTVSCAWADIGGRTCGALRRRNG